MNSIFLGVELQTWFEIFVGITVEGVLLSSVFFYVSNKSEKNMKRHIQEHLNETSRDLVEIKNELNTIEIMINKK